MLLVPDITAGTGTEFEETLVCSGSGGCRSRKERRRGPFPLMNSFPSGTAASGRGYGQNPRPNRQATFR